MHICPVATAGGKYYFRVGENEAQETLRPKSHSKGQSPEATFYMLTLPLPPQSAPLMRSHTSTNRHGFLLTRLFFILSYCLPQALGFSQVVGQINTELGSLSGRRMLGETTRDGVFATEALSWVFLFLSMSVH